MTGGPAGRNDDCILFTGCGMVQQLGLRRIHGKARQIGMNRARLALSSRKANGSAERLGQVVVAGDQNTLTVVAGLTGGTGLTKKVHTAAADANLIATGGAEVQFQAVITKVHTAMVNCQGMKVVATNLVGKDDIACLKVEAKQAGIGRLGTELAVLVGGASRTFHRAFKRDGLDPKDGGLAGAINVIKKLIGQLGTHLDGKVGIGLGFL